MSKQRNRRRAQRVIFSRGIPVVITGIDGTWQRECTMRDVSEASATLRIEGGSLRGLNVSEFFLLLSSVGDASRRCELDWVKGDHLGARFIRDAARSTF